MVGSSYSLYTATSVPCLPALKVPEGSFTITLSLLQRPSKTSGFSLSLLPFHAASEAKAERKRSRKKNGAMNFYDLKKKSAHHI